MPALEGKETNSSPLPIAATIARPIARTLIKRSHTRHPAAREPRSHSINSRSAHRGGGQSPARSSMTRSMRGDRASEGSGDCRATISMRQHRQAGPKTASGPIESIPRCITSVMLQERRQSGHGNTSRSFIHYRIIDPCIMSLLDQGLCLMEDTWERRSKTLPRRALATA
jgi:hypothetical protein